MFSTQTPSQQPKSEIQSKRQSMHSTRVFEERDKIKRAIRFNNMSQLLMKQNQESAYFIIDLSLADAHLALCNMLQKRDFVMLCFCLIEIQKRPHIDQQFSDLITLDFMHQLIKNTFDMMYQPEIIGIYKCLTAKPNGFHQVMFEYPEAVRNIVREIKKMKGGQVQDVYLEVLEDVCPFYAKRCKEDTAKLFGEIFQMLQNDTISFQHGLNILVSLSPFINSQIPFSSSIVHRLLNEYQKHNHSNNQFKVLQNIFLVLTKVIYYNENCDIISSWRMLQVVLHACDVLKEKLVNVYYNGHLLMAKLIDRIAKFQMYDLASNKVQELVCRLIEQYKVDYLHCEKIDYQVTTILINHLLTHSSLLQQKIFTQSYLYLFLIITKHCSHQALTIHYFQNSFFEFLGECIDHMDIKISGLALDILLAMFDRVDPVETSVILKDYCSLVPLLEKKLYLTQNPDIVKIVTRILEKFDEFRPQY